MRDAERRKQWTAWGVAVGLAVAWLALGLVTTRAFRAIPPDTAHYLDVARNLAAGRGFTVDYLYLHLGLQDDVHRISEMHGLLRPMELAALFSFLPTDEGVARIPGLLFGAATGLVAFALAAGRFGLRSGLLAEALVLLNPNLTLYAVLGTDDVGFAFFVLAALALLAHGLARGRVLALVGAGALAGLAVLEKPLGIFLPVLGLGILFANRRRGLARMARELALFAGPYALGIVPYLVRNWLAYGSPRFRFGPIEWIYRLYGFEGGLVVFPGAPSARATLEAIGVEGFVQGAALQVQALVEALAFRPPLWPSGAQVLGAAHEGFLPVGLVWAGALALVWLARREHFARLAWLGFAASAALVCGLYHFELRYFAFALPPLAVAVAALVSPRVVSSARGRRAGLALALALCMASAVAFGRAQRALAQTRSQVPCLDSLSFLTRVTQPGDRVMSFMPWNVAWFSRREGVIIPTGGPEVLARVARHYRAHYLLAHAMATRPETSRMVRRLERDRGERGELRVETVYRDPVCRVLRLDWDEG